MNRNEVVTFKTELLFIRGRIGNMPDNDLYVKMLDICDTTIGLYDQLEELKNDGSKYL
jgi:hypothetical protein